ncbi:MAG TPA: hypothetical protein VFK02_08415 [Kofleriaceae bacterium]|nr:hypothetical protein [Kofleriaceae bacterium]
MKKTISKLALKRETVRTLVDAELARVPGGFDDGKGTNELAGCAAATQIAAFELKI